MTKKEYLKTKQWKKLREAVFKRDGGKCRFCTKKLPKRWECHHLTYERLGHEDLEDLRALCPSCHDLISEIARRKDTSEKIHALKDLVKEFVLYDPYEEKRLKRAIELIDERTQNPQDD